MMKHTPPSGHPKKQPCNGFAPAGRQTAHTLITGVRPVLGCIGRPHRAHPGGKRASRCRTLRASIAALDWADATSMSPSLCAAHTAAAGEVAGRGATRRLRRCRACELVRMANAMMMAAGWFEQQSRLVEAECCFLTREQGHCACFKPFSTLRMIVSGPQTAVNVK